VSRTSGAKQLLLVLLVASRRSRAAPPRPPTCLYRSTLSCTSRVNYEALDTFSSSSTLFSYYTKRVWRARTLEEAASILVGYRLSPAYMPL
jgi:hypothetical protein